MESQRWFKYWPQVAVLSLMALGFGGYRYFAYYDTRSDDAYVSANMVNMAAIVSGLVTQVYVEDNQAVKKGDKLIELDSSPYIYTAERAKARLNNAQLNYNNQKLVLMKAEQYLKEHQDQYARYKELQSKQDSDKIPLNLNDKMKEQQVAIKDAEKLLKKAKANLDENQVVEAQAELDQANYELEHVVLTAPEDGYITNFNLRPGQYIEKGQGLFALVETKNWWVVTRYRETAIRLIKPGDKAKIMIDMYPGKVFQGHVHSIGWGINRVQEGDVAPSTLVYMEATDAWIRIAQRFPVRIDIDEVTDEYPLRIGASATTVTYR